MYELLSGVDELPMDPSTILGVKRGMNKVRVSVGEHVSEPSEVYILTCEDDGELSTFIVLFMVQPKVRIIYGYDGNPFGQSNRSEAENEAVEFVEAMGSILEDLPWEEMSGTERQSWLEGENLLGPAAEEILDASDVYEVEEVDEGEAVVEASAVEEAIVLEPVEEPEGAEEQEEKAQTAPEKAPEADDSEREDINDVLGKVFLKPELLASANRKVRFEVPSEIEVDVEEPEPEEAEALPEPEPPAGVKTGAVEQQKERGPVKVLEGPAAALKDEGTPEISVSAQGKLDHDTRMKVLRFLSRM